MNQDQHNEILREITRRTLFKQASYGIGSLALSSMLLDSAFAGPATQQRTDPLAPKRPHFKPKAKNVIFLFMAGAPSQLDLFDYKPTLNKLIK